MSHIIVNFVTAKIQLFSTSCGTQVVAWYLESIIFPEHLRFQEVKLMSSGPGGVQSGEGWKIHEKVLMFFLKTSYSHTGCFLVEKQMLYCKINIRYIGRLEYPIWILEKPVCVPLWKDFDEIEVKIWVVLCSSRNVLASVEHLQIWCPGSWDLVILNLAAKVASYTHWPILPSSPLKCLMQIGQSPGSWIVLPWVDFMLWLILEHWSQGFPTRKWLCICWVMTSGPMGNPARFAMFFGPFK